MCEREGICRKIKKIICMYELYVFMFLKTVKFLVFSCSTKFFVSMSLYHMLRHSQGLLFMEISFLNFVTNIYLHFPTTPRKPKYFEK